MVGTAFATHEHTKIIGLDGGAEPRGRGGKVQPWQQLSLILRLGVRGLESRMQRSEEDVTAIITTVIETRDDVRWLKRAVQALLADRNITIEEDDG
jgi:hypothetical protein